MASVSLLVILVLCNCARDNVAFKISKDELNAVPENEARVWELLR